MFVIVGRFLLEVYPDWMDGSLAPSPAERKKVLLVEDRAVDMPTDSLEVWIVGSIEEFAELEELLEVKMQSRHHMYLSRPRSTARL